MKRLLTLLLLLSLMIPYGAAFAQMGPEPDTDTPVLDTANVEDLSYLENLNYAPEIIIRPETPQIFTEITASIESKDNPGIENASITWLMDKTIICNGKGQTSCTFQFDSYGKTSIKARIAYSRDAVIMAEKTIRTDVNSINGNPNVENIPIATKIDISEVVIKSQPKRPMASQSVLFYLAKKNQSSDYDWKNEIIIWYVDGKQASPGIVGDDNFKINFLKFSGTTTVSVDIVGKGGNPDAELVFPTRDNPALAFHTNQAQRELDCIANATRMGVSIEKRFENEKDLIIRKSNEAIDNINQDIGYLESITDIGEDTTNAVADLSKMVSGLITNIGSGGFIKAAKSIADIGKFINKNPLSARLKYVYNKINYYKRLISWYESEVDRIDNMITSSKSQIEYQKNRCLKIVKQKPDLSPSIRKY